MTTRTRLLYALLAAVLTKGFVVLPILEIVGTVVLPAAWLAAIVVLGLCHFQWPELSLRIVAPFAVGFLSARLMVELSQSLGVWPGPLLGPLVIVAGVVATARVQPRLSVTLRPSQERDEMTK